MSDNKPIPYYTHVHLAEADVFNELFSEDSPAGKQFRADVYQKLSNSPNIVLVPQSNFTRIIQTWQRKDGIQ